VVRAATATVDQVDAARIVGARDVEGELARRGERVDIYN